MPLYGRLLPDHHVIDHKVMDHVLLSPLGSMLVKEHRVNVPFKHLILERCPEIMRSGEANLRQVLE
jgi:hypothetical protein